MNPGGGALHPSPLPKDARRLALLSEAGRLLADSLDVQATLRSVAKLAVPVLADWCVVGLPAEGKRFDFVVECANPAMATVIEALRAYDPPGDEAHGTMRAMRSGERVVVPSVTPEMLRAIAQDERHLEILLALDIRGGVIVPMKARGRVVGVLSLYMGASGRSVDDGLIELAEELARRAALAIDNARLFDAERRTRAEAEEARDRLARLQEMLAALAAARTPGEAADIVLRHGLASLRARTATASLLTLDGKALEIVGAIGYAPGEVRRFANYPNEPGLPLPDALLKGEPLWITTRRQLERTYPQVRTTTPTIDDSWAIVPLIVDDRPVGGLSFGFSDAREPTDADRRYLAALARVCAAAFERVRLSARLAETAAVLDTVFEAAPVGLAFLDPSFRYVRFNAAFAAAAGPTVAPGADARAPPEALRPLAEVLRRVEARGAPVLGAALSIPGPEGTRHVLASCYPVLDQSGAGHGIGVVLHDVTKMRRAEEAVRQSEAWLRAVYESLEEAVFIVEAGSRRILDANGAAERMFGWSREEMRGRTTEFLHVDREAFDEFGRLIAGPFASGKTVEVEFRMRRRNGEVFETEHVVAVLRRSGDILSVVRDIRARKRFEEERERLLRTLEAERVLLEETLQQMPAGVIIAEAPSGRITFANRALERIFGRITLAPSVEAYDSREPAFHVEDGRRYAAHEWPLARAVRAGETIAREEIEVERPDGTRRRVVVNAGPVRDRDGRIVAAVAVHSDVTDQRSQETELSLVRRQLAESEKLAALGTLVSGVAHEVRTPLTYVATNVALLERRIAQLVAAGSVPNALAADATEWAAAAQEGVDRIDRLVGDLRRYAHLRADHRTVASLDGVVREAVELFRATHRGATQVDAALGRTRPVPLDRLQIQQVVLNLLQNAAEAAADGAPIRIATRDLAHGAEIVVADRGPGIPEAIRDRVFDPFFTTKAAGTGLGLSIVRRILDAHGATIAFVCPPDGGTVFTVTLPEEPATGPDPGTPGTGRPGSS